MTPTRLDILEAIAAGEAQTAPALADWLGISRREASNALYQLRAAGLVIVVGEARTDRGTRGDRVYVHDVTPIARGHLPALDLAATVERLGTALDFARRRVEEIEAAIAAFRQEAA